jgi:hypothetical protein
MCWKINSQNPYKIKKYIFKEKNKNIFLKNQNKIYYMTLYKEWMLFLITITK